MLSSPLGGSENRANPPLLFTKRASETDSVAQVRQKITLGLGRGTQSWVSRVSKPRYPPEGNPMGGREERTT